MNSESQTQKVKSCNSCKRTLPVYFFGIRKFSNDGYNPCCKECRNFRRRKAYQSPSDSSDPILPLNTHNTHFLWSIPDSTINDNFIGLELSSLLAADVTFKHRKNKGFWITVKIPNGPHYILIHFSEKTEFISFAIQLLERLKLRLFHPADLNALKNWGFSKEQLQNYNINLD